MTCRIESSSACTSRAIAGTVLPPAEASTTIARRSRIGEPVPRRTICCSRHRYDQTLAWSTPTTHLTSYRREVVAGPARHRPDARRPWTILHKTGTRPVTTRGHGLGKVAKCSGFGWKMSGIVRAVDVLGVVGIYWAVPFGL